MLIAEDSPTMRHHLVTVINNAPGLRIVAEARSGEEALEMVGDVKPDIISMDIRMPGIDGLEATRRIMAKHPTPVVVVSGLLEQDIDLSFQALQAGALAVVEKPLDRSDPGYATKQRHLINTLVAMARVRVVRRWERLVDTPDGPREVAPPRVTPEVIAIGASAGGPSALSILLQTLPEDFPVPVVVTQHMPDEFIAGLARWLNKATPLRVEVAGSGLELEPGVVHLAPGSAHLAVTRQGDRLFTKLIRERGDYPHQPSVDVLFESVARVCGSAAVGIVLTGMGSDGARGLLAMRDQGAMTYAQDEASCTVFGMPGAAIERGAVVRVLSLTNLATTLAQVS